MKQLFSCAGIALLTFSYSGIAEPALATVTVTAARQAQNQSSGSISAISAIEQVHATHISELLTQSPGTWISRGNGQEHLTAIRSPVLTGGGGCGPFLMAEDNIALRAPAFCNVNQLFDANFEQAGRIEVWRGPGTAFHGSSAMHGIINIISPGFAEQASTTVTGEHENSHDYGRILVDHRNRNWILQGNAAEDNGYKEDSGFSQQKLRFKYRQQSAQWQLTHNLNLASLKQDTAGFITGKDAYKDEQRKNDNNDPDAYRDASSLRFSSSLDYRLGKHDKLLFTPYLRANEMDFLMHFQPGTPVEENGHHSLGVQSAYFHTLSANMQLVSGIDVDYSKGYLKQSQRQAGPSPNFPAGLHYDYTVSVLTSAAFLQTENSFNEKGLVTAGVRIEEARYDYTNKLADGNACSAAASNCRYTRPADDIRSFFNWSPKLSLAYEVLTDMTVYTTFAHAYRAPETSELFRLEQGQQLARIDSEEISSVETGVKGSVTAEIDYQLALFRMNKDNVIFKDSNRQNVDNQKTRHEGIEAGIKAMLGKQWLLASQLSYAKHQYDSNILLLDGSSNLIRGNIIDSAPRHIHNVILSWLPNDKLQLDIEAVYIGQYYLDPDNLFSYEGHTLTNLRGHYTLPDGWQLGLGIINATNQDYADRADITARTAANPVAQERYFIGEPRSFRVSISKTFQ